jgi:NO-binding membrane sensor protein with MHYT domain
MASHSQMWANTAYPVIAYLIAFMGSALGLACTSRLRAVGLTAGRGWLAAGAISLGTGIWGMHFVAMLGYSVQDVTLHYNLLLTALSWVIAVAFVSVGMVLVARNSSWPSLLGAGCLSGLGIAGMHYLGMAAILMPGTMHHDFSLVALSIVIAIVAATAALWATLRITHAAARTAAALVMGGAVCGMHYTGMLSVTSVNMTGGDATGGVTASAFIVPLSIGLTLIIFVVAVAVLINPVEDLVRMRPGYSEPR